MLTRDCIMEEMVPSISPEGTKAATYKVKKTLMVIQSGKKL